MRDRDHWEANALAWAQFTGGPEPDAYPEFAPRFMELLPLAGRRTLEVGCGEGRVCRDLRARGYDPPDADKLLVQARTELGLAFNSPGTRAAPAPCRDRPADGRLQPALRSRPSQ